MTPGQKVCVKVFGEKVGSPDFDNHLAERIDAECKRIARRAVLAERNACRRQLPMHWGPNYTKGAFKIFDQAAKARDARRKKR